MAKSESEVLIEEPDQGIAACGFSFAYAANRKIAARASRPRISSVRARFPRVSLVVIGGLIRLLAQERIEKLLQNRPRNNSGRRRITLAFVVNHKGGSGLHRNLSAEHNVLDDVWIHRAPSLGLRQGAIYLRRGRGAGAALQDCLDALEIRGAQSARDIFSQVAIGGPFGLVVEERGIHVLKLADHRGRIG